MKIKSVLAAIAAAAAISCTSVCAFADNAEVSSVPESVTEAADPMEGNPVSGVDGAAALIGVALVSGAALVISHKRG